MHNCQNGRSMIEMLGVLAIVGILSIGGIAGYSKTLSKAKNSRLITQINELVVNIRGLYISQKNFKGLNSAALLKTGVVPKEMLNDKTSPSKIIHTFGGEIIVFESKISSGLPKAFEIYFTGINRPTCVALATMDWGQDVSSGFMGIYAGVGDVTAPLMLETFEGSISSREEGIYTPGQHEYAVPLNVTDATIACACPNSECVIGVKYN